MDSNNTVLVIASKGEAWSALIESLITSCGYRTLYVRAIDEVPAVLDGVPVDLVVVEQGTPDHDSCDVLAKLRTSLSHERAPPDPGPHDVASDIPSLPKVGGSRAKTLKDQVESLEKRLVHETLKRCHWNQSKAAGELGLSRVGLANKIRRYRIAETEPA